MCGLFSILSIVFLIHSQEKIDGYFALRIIGHQSLYSMYCHHGRHEQRYLWLHDQYAGYIACTTSCKKATEKASLVTHSREKEPIFSVPKQASSILSDSSFAQCAPYIEQFFSVKRSIPRDV